MRSQRSNSKYRSSVAKDDEIDEIISNITLKRPRNPYTQYVLSELEKYKKKNKDKVQLPEFNKICASNWKKLSDTDKRKFEKAYEEVNLIKKNVNKDVYDLVTEEDLAFYLSLCLLLNFEVSNYKKTLSQNDTLVYLLYDKYPKLFGIVDDYYKCDYLKVNSTFEKSVKKRILSDPLLAGYFNVIKKNFKTKILKEILSFTSEIDYKSIKELLQIQDEKTVTKMVQDLILRENFPVVIDDINGVVLAKEKNPVDELLERSSETVRRKINDLIKFAVQRGIKSNLNVKKIEGDNYKKLGGSTDFDFTGFNN